MSTGTAIETKGEPLYAPPLDATPVAAVRGSVIVLHLSRLRDHGRLDAYREELGPHRELLDVGPADWVPFPRAMEHWHALDRLGLPSEEYRGLGRYVGERGHQLVLNTLVRLAGSVGVTPWLALSQFHKVWQRFFLGGGVAVYRTGEHQARIEVINCPCARAKMFQSGICGNVEAALARFCKALNVVERPDERTPMSLVLRASWQP